MSNGPEEHNSEKRSIRRRMWTTAGLTLSAIAVLGAAGGALWAWIFINERLAPWLSEVLTDSLDRPVVLGEVEQVSLTNVQFGPSAMPPTETDPDELYVESVDVSFNPLQLLSRRLNPRITLSAMQVYLEQNEAGQWVEVEVDLEDEDPDRDPFLQISPTVAIADSEVILLPYAGPEDTPVPLTIADINGTVAATRVDIQDPANQDSIVDAQEIILDFISAPEGEGVLSINGVLQQLDYGESNPVSDLDALNANLAIRSENIDIAAMAPAVLSSLPQELPITVLAGTLSSNLELNLEPQSAPEIRGTARLRDGAIAITAVPEPITDINAQARFQGNRVALEDVTAALGTLTARGGGLIDTRSGYDLDFEIAPFEVSELAEELGFELPITATGTFEAAASVTGPLADPEVSATLASTEVATIDQVQFDRIATELIYTPEALVLAALTVEPLAGGSLTGTGRYTFGDPPSLALQLEGRNLPADAIAQPYGLPDNLSLGTVALDADISGPLNDLTGLITWNAPGGTYPTSGTAAIAANTLRIQQAEIAGGTLAGTATLVQGEWDADLTLQGIQAGIFNEALQGTAIAGDLQLSGRLDALRLNAIQAAGDITAALRGGTLEAQFDLANGFWDALVDTQNFPVGQFFPEFPVSTVTADAQLSGSVEDFTLAGIQGQGTLTAAIAGGTVVSDFRLDQGFWQLDGQGRNLQLGQLVANLQGVGGATFQLAGRLDNLTPAGIQGRASLRLDEGLATAAGLSPQLARLRGPLTADLVWTGQTLQVEQLETAGLAARGTITPRLTGPGGPGIAAIDLALSAEDYALSTLPIDIPPLLGLTGAATFEGRLTGTPGNLALRGDLALADLALNDLIFDPLLTGEINFSSQEGLAVALLGPEDEIVVNYDVQPRQLDFRIQAGEAIAIGDTEGNLLRTSVYSFPLSALNLPPAEVSPYGALRGEIIFAAATINLQTLNTVGQIDVANLGFGYASVDRLFSGFTYADGVAAITDGEIRMIDRTLDGIIEDTRIYEIAARYRFNQIPRIQASVATDKGELQDILEILKITELADLQRGFAPEAGFIPTSEAEARSVLTTRPVGDPNATLLNQLRRLSEILELQFQEETATETAVLPPLSELAGTFSGQANITATLPEDIQVNFDLDGQSWQWGPNIGADVVLAQGSYDNGLITFDPLRFSSELETDLNADRILDTAYINLSGKFSLDPDDQQNRVMDLAIVNVPADELEDIANLPFDLQGRLNGNAVLRGQLTDPELVGNFQLVDGALNNEPIAQANIDFTYAEARLGLETELLLEDSLEPLSLEARVPYQLPFVDRPPADNAFSLKANLEDEGFALLNLFTDQVTWIDGEGEAILNIAGNLDRGPFSELSQFDGLILLEDATVALGALAEPVTDLNGRIRLNSPTNMVTDSRIIVEGLSGNFSDGFLQAQGTFPLINSLDVDVETEAAPIPPESANGASANQPSAPGEADAPPEETLPPDLLPIAQTPLTLDLEGIDLNIKGLYSGQVQGQVVVGGNLLFSGPLLTGAINLSNGTITIPEGGGTVPTPVVTDPDNGDHNGDEGFRIPPPQFSDLRLVLGRDIRIVQGGLLDVAGRGSLRLFGTRADLQPFGTIRLPSGRVGLFAASLRLAGNNDRAEFRGDFDPLLDVTLQTALPDATGPDIELTTSPFPRNEVQDTTIGNIGLTQQGNRLIRINARYTGYASELSDLTTDARNLQLSSSPVRSDQEIIALLSGNVIGALGALSEGDALGGFATIAGSALLSTLRDFLGDTVPLSEFRIFQVAEGTGQVNDTQDIGAEVGFDVTSNISVSVLKVLTNDTPFQFNARYRISDQFTLRGTTSYEDFRERTGVLLEYETRF